jgi:hypothetical protein
MTIIDHLRRQGNTHTRLTPKSSLPTATILSTDEDGHQKGDFLLHLPHDLAIRLHDYMVQLGQNSLCPDTAHDKPSGDISHAGLSGPVDLSAASMDLLRFSDGLPNFYKPIDPTEIIRHLVMRDPQGQTLIHKVLELAPTLPAIVSLPKPQMTIYLKLATIFMLVWRGDDYLCGNALGVDVDKLWLAKSMFGIKSTYADEEIEDEEKKKCVPGKEPNGESPGCFDADCGGNEKDVCTAVRFFLFFLYFFFPFRKVYNPKFLIYHEW